MDQHEVSERSNAIEVVFGWVAEMRRAYGDASGIKVGGVNLDDRGRPEEVIVVGHPITMGNLGALSRLLPNAKFDVLTSGGAALVIDIGRCETATRRPARHSELTKTVTVPGHPGIEIMAYPVTNKLFDGTDSMKPATCVSFDEAVEFAERLSKETGQRWRLPTEEEWLAACGEKPQEPIEDYCVFDQEECPDVGTKLPNEHGVHDAYGLVWEWTSTLFEEDSERRVLRGGSWFNTSSDLRAAYRTGNRPSDRSDVLGFRLVREVGDPAPAEGDARR